jgi:hypothetical protein
MVFAFAGDSTMTRFSATWGPVLCDDVRGRSDRLWGGKVGRAAPVSTRPRAEQDPR